MQEEVEKNAARSANKRIIQEEFEERERVEGREWRSEEKVFPLFSHE